MLCNVIIPMAQSFMPDMHIEYFFTRDIPRCTGGEKYHGLHSMEHPQYIHTIQVYIFGNTLVYYLAHYIYIYIYTIYYTSIVQRVKTDLLDTPLIIGGEKVEYLLLNRAHHQTHQTTKQIQRVCFQLMMPFEENKTE